MNLLNYLRQFFDDPAYRHGYDDIATRLAQHCGYSLLALAIAAVIAFPPAVATGHTGRGAGLVSGVAVLGRSLPSLGLLILLAVHLGLNFSVAMIPLIVIGIPPVLLYTHEGIQGVDRAAVDAAKGMGMSTAQVILRVELPAALPLILAGLRVSAVQIVATASLAAVVSFGGLGRYIVDGLYQYDYAQVVGGAFLIAVLCLVTLFLFWLLGRVVVSPGLRRR